MPLYKFILLALIAYSETYSWPPCIYTYTYVSTTYHSIYKVGSNILVDSNLMNILTLNLSPALILACIKKYKISSK